MHRKQLELLEWPSFKKVPTHTDHAALASTLVTPSPALLADGEDVQEDGQ